MCHLLTICFYSYLSFYPIITYTWINDILSPLFFILNICIYSRKKTKICVIKNKTDEVYIHYYFTDFFIIQNKYLKFRNILEFTMLHKLNNWFHFFVFLTFFLLYNMEHTRSQTNDQCIFHDKQNRKKIAIIVTSLVMNHVAIKRTTKTTNCWYCYSC